MKTKRNMKNNLNKNNKGWCFVAVAICCMLVCTSGMAAVTGVSKLQDQRNALVDGNNGMIPNSHKQAASFKEHAVTEDTRISEPVDVQSEEILEQYQTSSMFFTENRGQFPDEVLFQTHVSGATIYLCRDKVVSVFTRNVDDESSTGNGVSESMMHDDMDDIMESANVESLSVWATFEGANPEVELVGKGVLPHYNNYFIGNDPDKWYTHVPNFEEVLYQDIYSGIDLRYYFSDDGLKYDFIVDTGADPNQIQIRYDGVNNLEITDNGDISIETAFGNLGEKVPIIYQDDSTGRTLVAGGYQLLDEENRFGFNIDKLYDSSLPLIIDPELEYSTFLGGGGSNGDQGNSIVVDDLGCAYITGETSSPDFPTTPGAYDTTYYGGGPWGYDVFVTKLTPMGDDLEYSTFLGGSGGDSGNSIAVDASGCAYVTGSTGSSDFPTTAGAFDTTYNGSDVFVTKFAPTGDTLIYSTFLGGTYGDSGRYIVVDGEGYAYVTGYTSSYGFPTTPGAYDMIYNGGSDVFVTKLTPMGDDLEYSTFIGGSSSDYGYGIAVGSEGCAYITGSTHSYGFPTTPGAYDTTYNVVSDVFVTKLTPMGDELEYSTFIGGNAGDAADGIAVDADGFAYITGYTYSSGFPTTPGAYDTTYNGGYLCCDVFVTKLTSTGDDLEYSTFIGGSSKDHGNSIVVDADGFAYITGDTWSSDFPTTFGAYDTTYGGYTDVFVTKLTIMGDALMYSTFLGGTSFDYGYGIAVDADGFAYITGDTRSSDFPTTADAYDTTCNGFDAFVTKMPLYVANDVGVVSINSPGEIIQQGLVMVNATVENDGTDDQEVVNVNCSIYKGIDGALFMEDFEDDMFPPEGWSIVKYSDTGTWEQEAYSTGDLYEPPDSTGSSYYAEADNGEHPSDRYDVGLFSPPLDLRADDEVTLSFDRNFQIWTSPAGYTYGFGRVRAYSGGKTYSNLEETILYLDEDDPIEGIHTLLTLDVSSYEDPSEVYIEFYYNDENAQSGDGKFCIDNVYLFGTIFPELVYSSEAMVSVDAGSAVDVEFTPPWDAVHGYYLVTVTTLLPGDENPFNDQMQIFVTVDNCPPLCPWDVNFDGMVDPVDVGLVKYFYGQDPSLPEYSVYDVNLDGVIDPVDVGLVKYYYGSCPTCS